MIKTIELYGEVRCVVECQDEEELDRFMQAAYGHLSKEDKAELSIRDASQSEIAAFGQERFRMAILGDDPFKLSAIASEDFSG